MSQRANPFRIGLFVVGALALAVLAVALFTTGIFEGNKSLRVSYFRGSIGGLTVGSPVTFRGVKVGEVTKIRLVVDVKTLTAIIPVEYNVDRSKITWTNGAAAEISVERGALLGLRAQLVLLSFVTGQQAIDLDIRPDVPPAFLSPPGETLPEVPVMQSELESVKQQLTNVPIDEIAQQVLKTVKDLDALLAGPELHQTLTAATAMTTDLERAEREDLAPSLAALHKLLDQANGTMSDLRTQIDRFGAVTKSADEMLRDLNPALQKMLDDADRATAAATKSLDAVSSLLGSGQPSRGNLDETLRDLALTTRALRDFADEIRRDPSSLVVGKH